MTVLLFKKLPAQLNQLIGGYFIVSVELCIHEVGITQ
jgi:hypothetical protein